MGSYSVPFLYFLLAASVQAQEPLPPTYHDVAPILAGRCALCHNGFAVPLGVRLDSFKGVLEGSSRGQYVRPGSQRT
jgi:hypothetical protein